LYSTTLLLPRSCCGRQIRFICVSGLLEICHSIYITILTMSSPTMTSFHPSSPFPFPINPSTTPSHPLTPLTHPPSPVPFPSSFSPIDLQLALLQLFTSFSALLSQCIAQSTAFTFPPLPSTPPMQSNGQSTQ